MVIAETIAGLGAVKSAFDLAKSLKDINDATVRNAAIIELQEKILAAHQAQATLLDKLSELEKKIASLEMWENEKQRYRLIEVRAGFAAYTMKPGMENDEPPHYLCASCFNGRHKSILAQETWFPGRCDVYVCHDCGAYHYKSGVSNFEHQKLKPKPYRGS